MTDFCASCGAALVEREGGGRIACCPEGAQYWSAHKPLPADVRGFYQMTGMTPAVQKAWLDGKVTVKKDGSLVVHEDIPLPGAAP